MPSAPLTGPELITAQCLEAPGLIHSFTTRRGGVSKGSFTSLNFSPKWPEDLAAVAENHRLLARSLGFDPRRLYRVFQVHGTDGVVVNDESPAKVYERQADFLVTDRPGAILGVITADCVPVLLWDPGRPAVAAVHAGWRGLVAGVLEAAVSTLKSRYGSRPSSIRAALGPSIGPCCFEVGAEVVEAFARAFPDAPGLALQPGPGRGTSTRPHVDLWAAARHALQRAGLRQEHLADPPGCTHCD
ncbi:MAG: polyphenol oxidase family protein, partial [Polyangia bacterium]|nr:polyphenol oxidase family protein [Polyangia bacterium]